MVFLAVLIAEPFHLLVVNHLVMALELRSEDQAPNLIKPSQGPRFKMNQVQLRFHGRGSSYSQQ